MHCFFTLSSFPNLYNLMWCRVAAAVLWASVTMMEKYVLSWEKSPLWWFHIVDFSPSSQNLLYWVPLAPYLDIAAALWEIQEVLHSDTKKINFVSLWQCKWIRVPPFYISFPPIKHAPASIECCKNLHRKLNCLGYWCHEILSLCNYFFKCLHTYT